MKVSATSRAGNPGRGLFDEPPDDEPTGEQQKAAAFARLESHRPRLIRLGRRALLLRALSHGFATADDVRERVSVPPDVDARCLGAVLSLLAKLGVIRRIGFRPTARDGGHARHISTWQLIDRDKAMSWLAANPEFPEPAEGGAE